MLITCFLAISTTSYSAPPYYGPTFQNEHLYRIALRVRPHTGLTIQQVMVAILQANPGAFVNNNINGLKSGHLLRIPPLRAIEKIHPLYAVKAVNYQNFHWNKVDYPSHKMARSGKYSHSQISHQARNVKNGHFHDHKQATLAKSQKEAGQTKLVELAKQENHSEQTIPTQSSSKVKSSSTATISAPATVAAAATTAATTSQPIVLNQQTTELNNKLTGFIQETKQQQAQTNQQIASLEQQNQVLQTRVNQVSQQLKAVTYRAMQLTPKHSILRRGQGSLILENLRKNAVGLSSGIIALILLTYLLARTFRIKPKKMMNLEGSEMSVPSKLDLARAYMDMGDHSSARSVLQEVITTGNAEQRKGATDLLGKINRLK
jgi:FimV-like protein